MPWLEDLLSDRERLMKLMWVAVWVSIGFLVIGYVLIAMDLFG